MAMLQCPRFMAFHPDDECVVFHPLAQPFLTVTKSQPLAAADTPQLDAQRCRQKAAQRKAQRRSCCISPIVIPDPLNRFSLFADLPFFGGALGDWFEHAFGPLLIDLTPVL